MRPARWDDLRVIHRKVARKGDPTEMTEVTSPPGSFDHEKENGPGTGGPPDHNGSNEAVERFHKRNRDRKRSIFRAIGTGLALGVSKETGEQIVEHGHDIVDWFTSLLA